MSSFLVTGAGGFLGSAVCRALGSYAHNIEVHGLDDDSRENLERLRSDCPRLLAWRGSVTSQEDVTGAFGNACPDAVWHLAAIHDTRSFYERPRDVLNVQLRGTLNVIDACVRHGVKTLVLFSSPEVYQTPPIIPTPENVPLRVTDLKNPRYSCAGGKIAAELLAWHSPIERVLIVRPHNVIGPAMGFEHFIPEFIMRMHRTEQVDSRKPEFFIHDGAVSRAFIGIEDFADAMLTIWRHHEAQEGRVREIYHVGTEEQVSISHVAGAAARAMKREFRFRSGGEGQLGAPPFCCPDTRKVRALGWEPKKKLEDLLPGMIDWYLSNQERWPA